MRPPSLREMYAAERSRRLKAERETRQASLSAKREARELRSIIREQEREIRTLRREVFYLRNDRDAITQGVSPWVHLPYYGVVS